MLPSKVLSVPRFLWITVFPHPSIPCIPDMLQISIIGQSGKNYSSFQLFYPNLIIKKAFSTSICSNTADSAAAIGWKPTIKSLLLTADRQSRGKACLWPRRCHYRSVSSGPSSCLLHGSLACCRQQTLACSTPTTWSLPVAITTN